MKKAISVLLLTVMCAMVFVGCGSSENKTTSSTSISQRDTISKYLPHSEKVTWDSNVYDVMNNDNIIMDNDHAIAMTAYSPTIESITFDSAMYTFENSKIDRLSYRKKDEGDYQIISNTMSKLYGESYLDTDDVVAWHVIYPNGEKGDISLVKNASTGSLVLMYLKSSDVSASEGTSTNTSSEIAEKSPQEIVSKMEKIPVKDEMFFASPDECAEIINLYLGELSPIVLGEMVTGETFSWKDFTISKGTNISFFVDETRKRVESIHFNSIATRDYPEKNFQDYFMATILAIDPKMTPEEYGELCIELRFGHPRITEETYTVDRNGFTYSLTAFENNCFVAISPQK
jgi:hypothetical protein